MIRSRSSPAARFVNVTARICHGRTPWTPMRYAMRWARTRVLPLPAPARMRSGPSVVVTARACSGFRCPTISSARFAAASLRDASWAASRARRSSGVSSGGVSPGSGASLEPVRLRGRRCANVRLVDEGGPLGRVGAVGRGAGGPPAGRGAHPLIVGRRPSRGLRPGTKKPRAGGFAARGLIALRHGELRGDLVRGRGLDGDRDAVLELERHADGAHRRLRE